MRIMDGSTIHRNRARNSVPEANIINKMQNIEYFLFQILHVKSGINTHNMSCFFICNMASEVDSFVMWHNENAFRTDQPMEGISHSVSGADPFVMRIYFAHVTGVADFTKRTSASQK